MEEMPGDVLNDGRVPSEDGLGLNDVIPSESRWGCVDIPKTDRVIVRGRQEVSIQIGIPGQSVTNK